MARIFCFFTQTLFKNRKGLFKMSVDFYESKTRVNLMRAFAGESQARNRYTFAAE